LAKYESIQPGDHPTVVLGVVAPYPNLKDTWCLQGRTADVWDWMSGLLARCLLHYRFKLKIYRKWI